MYIYIYLLVFENHTFHPLLVTTSSYCWLLKWTPEGKPWAFAKVQVLNHDSQQIWEMRTANKVRIRTLHWQRLPLNPHNPTLEPLVRVGLEDLLRAGVEIWYLEKRKVKGHNTK